MRRLILLLISLIRWCWGYCPGGCLCNHTQLSVFCKETSLDMVPITLNPHIRSFYLHASSIRTLDDGFQFYESLEILDLSNNGIITIQDHAFRAQGKLLHLVLEENKLSKITPNTFIGMTQLQTISLKSNLVEVLGPGWFSGLTSLQTINLSYNRISSISHSAFLGLSKLTTLNLEGNLLKKIPTSSVTPLVQLDELLMAGNTLGQASLCDINQLGTLTYLGLAETDLRNLTSCHKNKKNKSKIRTLDLSGNWLDLPISQLAQTFPHLQHLIIGQTNLTKLYKNSFSGLNNLQTIDISGCRQLAEIEPGLFAGLPNLRNIILNFNPSLKELPAGFVSSDSEVTSLVATDNNIEKVSPSSLPWHKLELLDLTRNPLICDCGIEWLSSVIKEINETSVVCSSPPHLSGTNLSLIPVSELYCQLPQVSIICTSLVLLSIIMAATGFLVYRYRQQENIQDKLMERQMSSQSHQCQGYSWPTQMEEDRWRNINSSLPISSICTVGPWLDSAVHPSDQGVNWSYQNVKDPPNDQHWALNPGMAVYYMIENPDYHNKF